MNYTPQNREDLAKVLFEEISYLTKNINRVTINDLRHALTLCELAEHIDRLLPPDIVETIEYLGERIK